METLATPRARGARGQRSPDVRFDVRAKELPLYWFMKHGNEGGGFLYNHLSNNNEFDSVIQIFQTIVAVSTFSHLQSC